MLFDNMVGGGDVLRVRRLVVEVVGSGRGKWGADDDSRHYVNVQKLSACSIQHGSRATDRPPRS